MLKLTFRAVYVFGSVAKGRNRRTSDIDLAVMCRGIMEGMDRIELETTFSNLLHRDVDVVIFGQSSTPCWSTKSSNTAG